MKRIALFIPLLAGATLLSGCLVEGPPVVRGNAYPGYYGRGYYSEVPPGEGYGVAAAPYYGGYEGYGGGGVAVIETGRYGDRGYRGREYYERDGRRYSRDHRDGNRSGTYGDRRNQVPRTAGYNRANTGRTNFQGQPPRTGNNGGGNVARGSSTRPSNHQAESLPKQQ